MELAVCQQISLEAHLSGWSASYSDRRAVAAVVLALAHAARQIADLIARGPLDGSLEAEIGTNVHGDVQKGLDVRANALLIPLSRPHLSLRSPPRSWMSLSSATTAHR